MTGNTEHNEKQDDHGQMATDTTAFSGEGNMNKNVVSEKVATREIKEKQFYGVEDVPPPHLCLLFGLQVFTYIYIDNQYFSTWKLS